MKRTNQPVRNPADYGYPSNDIPALAAKALEITRRLTERYGELPFGNKDPMISRPCATGVAKRCHPRIARVQLAWNQRHQSRAIYW
jgi:hypothetical protein